MAVAIGILALGVLTYPRFIGASEQSAAAQTAADAAAIAGAQAVSRDALGALKEAVKNGDQLPCGLGREAAADFADRNGATVTEYCYYPASDRVEVSVRSKTAVEGEYPSRSAVGEVGLRLGPCRMPDRPTEEPTPTPTPTGTGTPSPTPTPTPEDVKEHGRCGALEFDVTFPGDGGPPTIGWGQLNLDLNPRLKS